MGNTQSKSETIDFLLKTIPLIVFLFLILNFIFNMGYFLILGINFFSLLTIRDYYEGTAPFIVLSLLIYGSVFNVTIFNVNVKIVFDYLYVAYRNYVDIPIRLLKLRYKDFIHYKFNRKKYNYSDKRELIWRKRDREDIKKELIKYKKTLSKYNPYILNLFLFTIILPIIVIFLNSFSISWVLLGIMLVLFLLIIYVSATQKGLLKLYFLFVLLVLFVLSLGLRRFLIDYTNVTMISGKYNVIRPISKGMLVRENNKIYFIDWEQKNMIESKNISYVKLFLSKSNNVKRSSNAK